MNQEKYTESEFRIAEERKYRGTEPDKVIPNWLDWAVYRLFFQRWNRIFEQNPHMKYFFWTYMRDWKHQPIQADSILTGDFE